MAGVESLLFQTNSVRATFDEWASASRAGLENMASTHRAQLAAAKADVGAKEAMALELEQRGGGFATERSEHEMALKVARAHLESLENALSQLPSQAAALRAEREAASAALATERAKRGGARQDMEHQLNELTRGVVMYKFLGLEFQRADDDRLLIRFTHLDPNDWEREFVFRVSLGEDDAYRVDGCSPPLESSALGGLLSRLNAPNESDPMEFPGFVIEMRRHFKAMVA